MATWTHQDILESIDEGKLRLAERQAEYDLAAQRRLEEENARIDTAWQPIIARIRESVPQWAWDFLTYPRQMPEYYSEHVNMIRPAKIDLQGMGLVLVYVYGKNPPMFAPARWCLADDEDEWAVQPDNGRAESKYSLPGNLDFLIALAQAYDNMAGYAELKAEANRRNAERQKAKEWIVVEQPETKEPAFDWLHKARWALGAATADGTQSAIAYALVGILEQLRLVTTSLWGGTQHAIQTFDNSRGQV